MTTIAWDGKSLAGDTRHVAGGMPFPAVKVRRLNDGRLFGACGTAEDCEAARIWLEQPEGTRPTVKDLVVIVITQQGRLYRYEEKLIGFEVTAPFHAIGSGRDYAIAALHYGKCAREAVELAAQYDVYTSAPVTVLELD